MASPIHFILLYSIINNTLYVHYPPRVLHGMVCFENNTYNNGLESCNYMKIVIINNNTATYTHKMNKVENRNNFFKILYYYPNNTIFDTNWIEKSGEKSLTSNCTQVKNENNSKCVISFILNVIISISLLSLLSVLAIVYYHNRV